MILSFKKEFESKILDGSKIHTIRIDVPNRWKEGNKIHFATGVRTKRYKCFKEGICTGVQKIQLCHNGSSSRVHINIEGRILCPTKRLEFARNDGFKSYEAFETWFIPLIAKTPNGILTTKLIHWTNRRY